MKENNVHAANDDSIDFNLSPEDLLAIRGGADSILPLEPKCKPPKFPIKIFVIQIFANPGGLDGLSPIPR